MPLPQGGQRRQQQQLLPMLARARGKGEASRRGRPLRLGTAQAKKASLKKKELVPSSDETSRCVQFLNSQCPRRLSFRNEGGSGILQAWRGCIFLPLLDRDFAGTTQKARGECVPSLVEAIHPTACPRDRKHVHRWGKKRNKQKEVKDEKQADSPLVRWTMQAVACSRISGSASSWT